MTDLYTATLAARREAVARGEERFLLDLMAPAARITDPVTSHAAAAMHQGVRAEQRRKLLAAFEAAGPDGLNADEADAACDFYTGTAGRRLHELESANLIRDTKTTRPTRRGGRGMVYVGVK